MPDPGLLFLSCGLLLIIIALCRPPLPLGPALLLLVANLLLVTIAAVRWLH